ncbi:MAG: conjugal transfer protein TraL, partial [Rhodomicrobium sp.]
QLDDHTFGEKQTFGADVSQMTRAGLTFAEVQGSPEFSIMAKHRLKRVEQDLYGKFAVLLAATA